MIYDYTADVDLAIAVERDDEAGARENAWAILGAIEREARGTGAGRTCASPRTAGSTA